MAKILRFTPQFFQKTSHSSRLDEINIVVLNKYLWLNILR